MNETHKMNESELKRLIRSLINIFNLICDKQVALSLSLLFTYLDLFT